MLIIAHRGASASEKENTREAFVAAHKMGAEAVETDIRRCKFCGKLVLSHDPIRTEEECRAALAFEDFLSIKVKGAHLPLSNERFFLGEQMQLHLEIKEKGLIHEILEMTQGLRCRDKIVFSSFLWLELFKIRFLEGKKPRAKIGLLWDPVERNLSWWLVAAVGKILKAKSIHFNLAALNLNREMVEYFRKKRFLIYAYSDKSFHPKSQITLALFLDLDGIFSDCPAYAKEILWEITLQ
ncbi:hypothetical protein A3G55_04525 [Candidatus Giovannonibacteria bacterium RIFCSPLOWO2_12_FULL_44_25]|uniref:GP-PDE domain-containing protein n=2 Tax=Candidatus Giovannoniibacteriota TaxID=1752738 RepID=A0A1F5WB76_9BACT|nr:MAG: Glycerophosphoryl diester phosphodiesterase [Parcubacteria group bacterium GW2011_GWC1_44_10]KKT59879.1 MAG: Glycerophosphoryl diester phosphodiesterase [Candidatus Giovannonibacteria bacterium GW2011_GWA1_44_25]KKU29865.1 MAG: Glycerophosphoryl diester phosphodiesterase [Candidatus Giovannonibacteria bacterium GW2011_GWB1_46_20]OGF48930.1 MAG: hypothetical protein A2120_04995 [Candidatus Giovannonibacteria bacterium GWA2_45_15]OGF59706.1 MAG: hypothetical protein A2W40_01310 [Candidatu